MRARAVGTERVSLLVNFPSATVYGQITLIAGSLSGDIESLRARSLARSR